MAYPKDKIRLTVAVDPELNAKIEKLADAMHISKTALIITMIEQNIDIMAQTWAYAKNPEFIKQLIDLGTKAGVDVSSIQGFETILKDNEKGVEEATKLLDEISKK